MGMTRFRLLHRLPGARWGLRLIGISAVVVAAVAVGIATGLIATGAEKPETSGAITVIYNHEGTAVPEGMVPRGGFSSWIQAGDHAVLFDTGGEASVLMGNAQAAGFELGNLDAVVISHNHWDHVYGLPGAMSIARDAPVYVAAPAAAPTRTKVRRDILSPSPMSCPPRRRLLSPAAVRSHRDRHTRPNRADSVRGLG